MIHENKQTRHFVIKQILDKENIPNQDKLRIQLKKQGYNITQATLSRDLKELLWHSTNRICTWERCRKKIEKFEDLEIDHRFAHARGGKTKSANAQIIHSKCNKKKGKG